MQETTAWATGPTVWSIFVDRHPELGYSVGRMNFHNFLRVHREALLRNDAIRMAKRRYWIAETERFVRVAFDCATGMDMSNTPKDSL